MKLDQFVADSIGADFDVIASLGKDAVVQMVKGLPITRQADDVSDDAALFAKSEHAPIGKFQSVRSEGDATKDSISQFESDHMADFAGVISENPDGSMSHKVLAGNPALYDTGATSNPALDAWAKVGEIMALDDPRKAPTLSEKMAVLDIVDDWIKAVRGRVEYELLHGNEVPGYKLVQGKQGNRSWKDAEEAEAKLKSMRLKKEEMYNYTLISPTNAEKLLKDTPKRWASLQENIGRSPGQPSVAPVSDKRPALVIKPVADEFEAVDDEEDLA